jgi:hypothetical protein
VECYNKDSSDGMHKEIVDYISAKRYKQVAKTLFTAIFADEDVYEGF